MAEASQLSKMGGDTLTRLAQETTCAACNNQLKDTRVLSCCHFFCRECLQDLIGKDGRLGTIVCPTCSEASLCVNSDMLPRVMFVDRLQGLYHQLSQLKEGESGAICGMCSESKSSSYCEQCGEFVCEDCVRSHRKMKAKFGEHRLLSFNELKCSESSLLPPRSRYKTCGDHDEQCKLYCFDCTKLICRDCTVIAHSKHKFDFIKKTATDFRESILRKTTPLKQLHSDVQDATKRVTQMKNEIQEQQVFVKSHIREKFSEMVEELKRREEELLSETEQKVQHKLTQLDRQDNNIAKTNLRLKSLLDYIRRNLEIVADEDLISVQQQLQDKLDSERKNLESVELTPVQAANIAVKIVTIPDLATLVREKATMYDFPLSKDSDELVAEIGRETTHYVTDSFDTSHMAAMSVTASLKSTVDGSTVDAHVTKTGKGLYEVTCTPVVRGRHKLQISVDGKPIPGKPRPVFAAISPAELGPLPVRVLTGFKHPFSAEFDREERLLVTESNGMKISRVHREGKMLTKNGHFVELDIPSPTGLAIDKSTGDIFVASGCDHSLLKYSDDGKLLGEADGLEIEGGDMDHPCGLTLANNELFVCDRNNSRVRVFDRDLKYLRSFGSHGNQPGELHWPYNLVQNDKGHVMITDCDNHRIQELSRHGEPVASFGSKGNGQGQLKRPMGLCIGRTDNLFVTEFENHRLSVFDMEGGHVCSLGKYGTRDGEMCYPAGVAIDADGFVYVCDQGNNRIQVF